MQIMFVFLALGLLLAGVAALIVAAIAIHQIGVVNEQVRALTARLARIEGDGQHVPREAPTAPGPDVATTSAAAGMRAVAGDMPRPASGESSPVSREATASQVPPHPARSLATATSPARDIETWVGAQWLTWVGVLGIFLGTAFFLAVDLGRSPFSGTFQVLAGFAVGVGFVLAGRLLTGRTHGVLGQGLLGGGVALLFLAAYGAYGFHHLVPAPVAYIFLLGVAVAGAFLALHRNSYAVALLTVSGALLAPGLLSVPGDPAAALFPYLLAVNLGGAIVSARRPWPLASLVLFLGTVLILGHWWDGQFTVETRGPALLVCTPLWLLYAGLPLFRWRGAGAWHVVWSLVVAGASLLFAWVLYGWLAPELTALRGVALALLALFLVAGARLAVRVGRAGPAARLLHYTGLAVAVIAVPVQLDLAWVTLAWSLFGLILVTTGLVFDRPTDRLAGLLVDVLAVARVLGPDTIASFHSEEPYALVWNTNFLAGLAAVGVLGLTAYQMLRRRDRLAAWERQLPTVLILTSSILLLWRISIESAAWFDARAEVLARSMRRPSLLVLSLIWVIYSGLMIFAGFLARFRPIRLLGVVVLGLLVVKMLTFDLSVLETGYRIASFLGVGIVLLAISVLYQRERRT